MKNGWRHSVQAQAWIELWTKGKVEKDEAWEYTAPSAKSWPNQTAACKIKKDSKYSQSFGASSEHDGVSLYVSHGPVLPCHACSDPLLQEALIPLDAAFHFICPFLFFSFELRAVFSICHDGVRISYDIPVQSRKRSAGKYIIGREGKNHLADNWPGRRCALTSVMKYF